MTQKKTTKKSKKWTIIGLFILFIICSMAPGLNRLSPMIITPPVWGTVTNAITGKPIKDFSITSGLYADIFLVVHSDTKEIDSKSVRTDEDGNYYIKPHITFKLPLLQSFQYQIIMPGGTVHSFSWDRRMDIQDRPWIVNPALCENPGGNYRPAPKVIEKCKNNKAGMVLNNIPEICDTLYCFEPETCIEHKVCKEDLAKLYQDVGRGDDCMRMGTEIGGKPGLVLDYGCPLSKAIKYNDISMCNDIYIYIKEKFNKNETSAPSIFDDYFGYGNYSYSKSLTYRDACITMVAYQLGDLKICDQIEYKTEKEYCKYFVDQKNLITLEGWDSKKYFKSY